MFNADSLVRHSVDTRQFIDFRQSALPNGMRIIDAYNSSGLHVSILPDRGLDIWAADFKGIPLTWISQGSPHAPDFGLTWVQQFNGGLLTTCGLTHVGPPETDEISGQVRDLHGRYSRLRASAVVVEYADQSAILRGVVSEQRLFGEQLRLERTYRLIVGEPSIHLSDTVTNLGDQPIPLMLLYHINVGYPLVRAGAVLHTPHAAVYPRDDDARIGFDHWQTYEPPQPGFREQVHFHHLKQDMDERTEVLLQNPDFAFLVSWDAAAMPYLTQWKNTRDGIYVSGIEPGNCIPEGLNSARRSQRATTLAPGDSLTTDCTLSVLDTAQAIGEARARIDDLQANGMPAAARLNDFAKEKS